MRRRPLARSRRRQRAPARPHEAALTLHRKLGVEEEGRLRRHHRRRSGELRDSIVPGLHLD